METYGIGKIIREERIRKKISQEELCFGICSVPTLSRIENGAQKPTLKVEEALLERLGHSTENLIVYAEDSEVRMHGLETEIKVRGLHREKIDDLLLQYEALLTARGTGSPLERQFLQLSRAMQGLYTKEWPPAKVREELTAALRLTIPDFSERNLSPGCLYTNTELQILNNLAIAYAEEERYADAVWLLLFLARLLEQEDMDVESKSKNYPMLVHNLVRIFEETQQWREMQEYARKGIDYCVRYNRINSLPDFVYSDGLGCQMAGKTEEAVRRYEQAICLLEIVGRNESADYLRGEINTLKSSMGVT